MASRGVYAVSLLSRARLCQLRDPVIRSQIRTAFTESGAIMAKPEEIRFPVTKVLVTVVPFLIVGSTISKNGAALLEEMDIFVPEDDDD